MLEIIVALSIFGGALLGLLALLPAMSGATQDNRDRRTARSVAEIMASMIDETPGGEAHGRWFASLDTQSADPPPQLWADKDGHVFSPTGASATIDPSRRPFFAGRVFRDREGVGSGSGFTSGGVCYVLEVCWPAFDGQGVLSPPGRRESWYTRHVFRF